MEVLRLVVEICSLGVVLCEMYVGYKPMESLVACSGPFADHTSKAVDCPKQVWPRHACKVEDLENNTSCNIMESPLADKVAVPLSWG